MDAQNFLSRIDCPNPDTLHRVYVTQTNGEYTAYFRHDLPNAIYEQLHGLPLDTLFTDREVVKAILAQDAPCNELFVGKSYIFPPMETTEGTQVVNVGLNHYALMINGQVVSSCESSRENEQAAEAWVFTDPAYRGCGYAEQVVAAWSYALQRQGKVPFYSHKVENLASARVAQKLGLIQYIADVGYS